MSVAYYFRPIKFSQKVDLSHGKEYISEVGSFYFASPFVESIQFHLSDETRKEIALILTNLKLRNTLRGPNELYEDTHDPQIAFQVYSKEDLYQLVIMNLGREFITISSARDSSSDQMGTFRLSVRICKEAGLC